MGSHCGAHGRRADALRDEKRQQMKLNFLLTQSEAFSSFISKKVNEEADQVKALGNLDTGPTGNAAIDAESLPSRGGTAPR